MDYLINITLYTGGHLLFKGEFDTASEAIIKAVSKLEGHQQSSVVNVECVQIIKDIEKI